jgi:hypothetical protein
MNLIFLLHQYRLIDNLPIIPEKVSMKRPILQLAAICSLAFTLNTSAAVLCVDVNGTNPTPPYADWGTAATNIQDAIDAASDGDQVLVTNGVYQTGGRITDMTNRVAVIKLITVQSVNGPAVTIIRGYQTPGTINGAGAVRGVCLAGGATLSGFTVTGGGANSYAGGIYCASTSEIITNCVVTGNASASHAGGVYYGTLYNCVVSQNVATSDGGGSYHSHLYNCLVTTNSANNGGGAGLGFLNNCVLVGNSARTSGGGTYTVSSMKNCTIIGNSAGYRGGGTYGNGTFYQNCIIYYNTAVSGSPFTNVFDFSSDMYNCCLTPRLGGTGNIANPPAFVDLASGNYRLQIGSPCIDAGTNINVYWSTDLDGNPRIFGGTVDMGAYENQYAGVAHYVSISSANPVPPYTNWTTAATNIQNAVGAALDGEVVIAGDGVYGTGGVAVYGSEANRVALTNGITLMSLNGPKAAIIMGGFQTRCVYVGSNAVVSGFTITNGHARTSGNLTNEQSGGGIWCEAGGAVVNCLVISNFTGSYSTYFGYGGGVYGGTISNCTLAYNTAGSGGGVSGPGTLWNCILTNNVANSGGGAYGTALYNCILSNNSVVYYNGSSGKGGGVSQCMAYNCILTGNITDGSGGGTAQGTNFNCSITGNIANSGGGTYQSTNINCIISGNAASSGGGAYGGLLYNCVLSGNKATNTLSFYGYGGGLYSATIFNCTVTGNSATSTGGGMYGGTAYNSIVYFNSAPGGSNWTNNPLMYYCCTTPKLFGGNNITNAPLFVDAASGDFRLRCGSPGINAGNNSYVVVATDFNGNPRIADGTVDMGACEFNPVLDLIPQIRKAFSFDNFAAFYPVSFAGQVAGCPDYFWWDFGDGVTVTNQTSVGHAWTSPGIYNVVLTAYSASLGYGLSATTQVSVVQQPVYYVNPGSPAPAAPYTSWTTAAHTIQDGIRVGNTLGRLVLVTNGSYQGQVTTADGTQWKNVMLTNIVMVQSVNGPGSTIINNYNPYRVACVGNNSILSGFTVTGGSTLSGSDLYKDLCGGGIWCEPIGMVTNCIVTGNSASYGGGGAYQGIFYDCVFSNNTVPNVSADGGGGGGAYLGTFYHCLFITNSVTGGYDASGGGATCQSTLFDCYIVSNLVHSASRAGGCYGGVLSNCVVMNNQSLDGYGGGASRGTLYHCTLSGNYARASGGGSRVCTLYNCTLVNNRADSAGGGASLSALYNCLVVSNQAAINGGGAYGGPIYNCTIVKNSAARYGGFYGSESPSLVYNSIIYGNTAPTDTNWGGTIGSRNSCSIPQIGPMTSPYFNITNDPVFVDAAFHLSATSPCRGKGSSLYATGTDMDGETWNSPPSMGADEVYDADFIGALSVIIQSPQTNLLVNRSLALAGQITGRAAGLEWSFGDGTIVSNVSYFTSHLWTTPGDYSVVFTAYNTDNPGGVSTNLVITVLPIAAPALETLPISPSAPSYFHFKFDGQFQAVYTIQKATNLAAPIVWTDLQTITSTGGVVNVVDRATNAAGYYRVGVQ